MPLLPLEAQTLTESLNNQILRYILDALTGGTGGSGGPVYYDTPVITRKSAGASYTVPRDTTHSIAITAETENVEVGVGSSTCEVLAGTTLYLTATTLFNDDIIITSGAGGSAHIFEMRA